MICKKCGKEFLEDWRKDQRKPCRFCSRGCANTQVHSKETKEKIRKSVNAFCYNYTDEQREELSLRAKKTNSTVLREYWEKRKSEIDKELLEADFSSLSFERLRKRVLLEQDLKCNVCGLSDWNNKPISLELEHKDGDNQNNARENLEGLCPNCHSQTDTFRGRNKNGGIRKKTVFCTDEVLVETFIEEGNIRKTLLKLGYAAKGANYGRVKKALTLAGIPYKENVY